MPERAIAYGGAQMTDKRFAAEDEDTSTVRQY